MRTRSKPLEYWRGERIDYQGRPSGKIYALVSQNNNDNRYNLFRYITCQVLSYVFTYITLFNHHPPKM